MGYSTGIRFVSSLPCRNIRSHGFLYGNRSGWRTIRNYSRPRTSLLKRFTIPEGKLIEASEVPPFSELFAASGDTTVFWNGEALLIHSHSRADTVRPDYRTVRAVQRIWIDTGGIHVLDERQNTWDVETTATEQWSIRSSDVLSSVRRISPDTIIIGTENDDSIRFSCSFELGTIQYIGTLNGYHVVLAERILNPSPLTFRNSCYWFPGQGRFTMKSISREYTSAGYRPEST